MFSSTICRFLVFSIILIVKVSCACNNEGMVSIPPSLQNFTSAAQLTLSEQSSLFALYPILSNISDYTLTLTSQFSFYMSYKPICNKKPTSLQSYNGEEDIWICFDTFYMLQCNQQWELLIKCGTFIQFHQPFNPKILVQVNLSQLSWLTTWFTTKMTSIMVKGLCAGLYHVWFVYYSRGGKFIRGVKTIFIAYPSCNC